MPILNMQYGGGNPYDPFHLNGISDLAVVGGDTEATITWTDPGDLVVDGQTLATWSSTKLVRKTGSAPTDSSDGTLVVEETVADTYSVSGYTDTGLTNGTTYYYATFAVADNGLETISNTESVTPIKETPLCFTANTAGSTVALMKGGTPTAVSLEKSTDGTTWTAVVMGNNVVLSNIGDKVYFRNTSTTDTGFSTSSSNYYHFAFSGSLACSGNITSLLNKNYTDTVSSNCFRGLFRNASQITSAPSLPATTIAINCYDGMFSGCNNLETLPKLPATTLEGNCYGVMFYGCTKIKISETQTGAYQIPYRIPTTGTGTTATGALDNMFASSGGTFTGTPTINTTYYTSNTLV